MSKTGSVLRSPHVAKDDELSVIGILRALLDQEPRNHPAIIALELARREIVVAYLDEHSKVTDAYERASAIVSLNDFDARDELGADIYPELFTIPDVTAVSANWHELRVQHPDADLWEQANGCMVRLHIDGDLPPDVFTRSIQCLGAQWHQWQKNSRQTLGASCTTCGTWIMRNPSGQQSTRCPHCVDVDRMPERLWESVGVDLADDYGTIDIQPHGGRVNHGANEDTVWVRGDPATGWRIYAEKPSGVASWRYIVTHRVGGAVSQYEVSGFGYGSMAGALQMGAFEAIERMSAWATGGTTWHAPASTAALATAAR